MAASLSMTPATRGEIGFGVPARPLHDGSSQLGSGTITGELGEGGMAVVYEIWNEPLGVKRAVKVLKPHCSQESYNRFHTEMKLMAQLDHPNIVTIHTVGQWHGLPYIEMDRVDGRSLHYLIAQRGALPTDVSVAVALVVARALRYTHSFEYTIDGQERLGLLHRDLKPANILVSTKGKVRLTDFGIATPVNVSLHTPDGNVVGSLQYIAPEQLEGKEAGPAADVYSFGCVLYEMLTGFQLFPHTNITKLVSARLDNDYEPLSTLAPNLPPRVRRLVERCLRVDARRRPSNMKELCRELGRIYESLTNDSPEQVVARFMRRACPPRPTPSAPRRSSGGQFRAIVTGALAASLLGALTLGAGPLVMRWGHSLDGRRDEAAAPRPASARGGDVDLLIDSLRLLHGTPDLLTIMENEEASGNHAAVLALGGRLSTRKARSTLGVLLTTRALEATGGLTEDHFRESHISDAEFLLVKARWYYRRGRYHDALGALRSVSEAPCHLLSAEEIRREAKLDEARCLTALARQESSPDAKEDALACWRDIRYVYRKQTDSAAYKEAIRTSYLLASL